MRSVSKIERAQISRVGQTTVIPLTKALGISIGALLEMEADEWAAYLEELEEI